MKVSVLSRGPNDAGLLLKTVSKPVKALSACPTSPCNTAAPATPSTPAPATANAALNLTGNPMVDMMSVFSMMADAANAGQNPLGAVLNFPTAMSVIAGVCVCMSKLQPAAGIAAFGGHRCRLRTAAHGLTHGDMSACFFKLQACPI